MSMQSYRFHPVWDNVIFPAQRQRLSEKKHSSGGVKTVKKIQKSARQSWTRSAVKT